MTRAWLVVLLLISACEKKPADTALSAPTTSVPTTSTSTPTPTATEGTCAAVCEKREVCLHKDDLAGCLSACTRAQLNPAHLAEYGAQDCAGFAKSEPDHRLLQQAVRTCGHLIDCGVKGSMPTCLGVVKQNLASSAYGPDQLSTWESQDCGTILKTVVIDTPAPAPGKPSCRSVQCSEGAQGDAVCRNAGCAGGCFWGGCNSF
jgi:hypothetical protein